VRQALARKQPMKDSTVRTVLRRLEEKGYLSHEVSGRTYVYRERVPARKAATQAVRQIVDRFCEGSVEQLLLGMVDDRIVTAEQLEELARKIAEAEAEGGENES
jgi:predicted transcriptional regulator